MRGITGVVWRDERDAVSESQLDERADDIVEHVQKGVWNVGAQDWCFRYQLRTGRLLS